MCQRCDKSDYIFESLDFKYGKEHKYFACDSCRNGSHRSNTPPLCSCNKGYYYDGLNCVAQKIGIIYEETFESVDPLNENWNKNSDDAATSAYIENASRKGEDRNKAVRFYSKVRGGDIFYNKYYQAMPFDEYVWIAFDYNDKKSSTCYIQYGYNAFEQFNSKHNYFHSTFHGYDYDMPKTTDENEWTHFEFQAPVYSQVPISLMFQDLGQPSSEKNTNSLCYIDNIQMISSHGLPGINFSHYSLTHPTILILSIDYDGYNGELDGQQFGFDSAEMTKILKTNDWDKKNYAIYIEELKEYAQVKLYKQKNGQTFGDAYGRFVSPRSYNDKRYFYIGDHIVFDNNFAQQTSDFKLKDGNCLFEGPLKLTDQNLENCVDDCKDYETVEEAMKKCLEINACDGVTFSHKLWGGNKSKGFVHGYGYQLRKSGSTPTDRGYDRVFEHSWKKRKDLADKYQLGTSLNCSDCSYFCSSCFKLGECLQCKMGGLGRSNIPPKCVCSDGYYDIPNQLNCGTCDNKCSQCEKAGVCTKCKDANKIAPDSCLIQCDSCKSSDKCETCKSGVGRSGKTPNCECSDGYYHVDGQVDCQRCDSKCSKCDRSGQCTECKDSSKLPPNCEYLKVCDIQCSSCKELGKCETCKVAEGRSSIVPNCECKDKYYQVIGQADCKQCDSKCSKCVKAGECSECQDSTRLTPQCELLKKCEVQCDSCKELGKCLTCKGGIGRNSVAPECKCEDSYYSVVNRLDCEKCDDKCSKCNKAGECTECKDSARILPNCELLKVCDVQCDSCKEVGKCLNCKAGIGRSKTAPECKCEDTYYEVAGQLNCVKCDDQCSKCTKSGECTECKDSSRLLPKCELLKSCDVHCDSCKELGKCLTCKGGVGRSTKAPNCECQDKYYAVAGQLNCEQCDDKCSKCTKAGECKECKDSTRQLPNCELLKVCDTQCDSCKEMGKCLTCKVGVGRSKIAPECKCEDTYYEVAGQLNCIKCDDQCSKCTKSGECTECKDSSRLLPKCELLKSCDVHCDSCKELGKCLTCKGGVGRSTKAPNCECQDKYYAVAGQLNCEQCDDKCSKCTKAGECTECKDSTRQLPNCELLKVCDTQCDSCKEVGKCLNCKAGIGRSKTAPECKCEDTYYAVAGQLNCVKCDDQCSKCTKSGECTECKDSSRLLPKCELLKICDVQCSTCKQLGKCESCEAGIGRSTVAPECKCEDSYYSVPKQLNCEKCDDKCSKCNKAGECTECKDSSRLPPSCEFLKVCSAECESCKDMKSCVQCKAGTGRDMKAPKCGCEDSYYAVSNQLNCEKCDSLCETCEKKGSCTKCKDNTKLLPNCVQLKACDVQCSTCKSLGKCDTCQNGEGRNMILPSCGCKDTYYEIPDQLNCGKCDGKCSKCVKADECTECKDSSRLPPNCLLLKVCNENCDTCISLDSCESCKAGVGRSGKAPQCGCNDGYYAVKGQLNCGKCNDKCEQCTNSTSCQKCKESDKLEPDCIQLKKCSIFCDTCIEIGKCQTCKSGTGRDMKAPECGCQDSYYQVENQLNCEKCNDKCSKCNKADECTECKDSSRLPPHCELLKTCNVVCKSCKVFDQCEVCQTGVGRSSKAPDCLCEDKYYAVPGKADCERCDDKCEKCTKAGSCTQCKNPLLTLPDCLNLKNCDIKCASCKDLPSNCIKCSHFTRVYAQKCVCMSGYYDDGQIECKLCKVECNQCDSKNQCTLCKFGVGRSMNVKEGCKCASQYYEVKGELNCRKCSRQCEECSEFPNKCTKCADSRALAPECKPVIQGGNFSIATSNPVIAGSVCERKCLKCENKPDNCTMCRGTNRTNMIPKCECLEGFHDENGTQINCLQCPMECKQCKNSKQCSLCDSKSFRELNLYSGKCECAFGYKENQQRQCQKCYFYKNICLFKCPDQTKTDENGKICQDTQVKIQQHALIIIVCGVTIMIMLFIWGLLSKFFFKKNNEMAANQNSQLRKIRDSNITSSAHLTIL